MRGPFNYRFGLASPFYDNETGLFPAGLFTAPGSRGFFYDFSDYSTMFGDTAGSTPVTGVGQSVGLVLDESRGLALGPELVTNGDFSGGATGWTVPAGWAITGGAAVASTTSASIISLSPLVAGRTYRVEFDVVSYTSGTLFVRVGAGAAATTTSSGRKSFTLTASSTAGVEFYGGTVAASIDNISVREIPGNHATQATAGSRVLTQVRPMFTQRNRAVGSELVENTFYWPASAVQNGITMTKVAQGVDTDGLPYVDVRYQGTATGTSHEGAYPTASSRTAGAAGNQFTASVICRRVGGSLTGVSGLRTFVVEETAPSTFLGITLSALVSSTSDTEILATRTLSTGNQARTAVSLEFTNGATIDITYRIKALQLELGSTRTTYQPAVSGELRNRAIGSGDPGNLTYWGPTNTTAGVTTTKVGSGFDANGLPYVDWRVTGTASANSGMSIYSISFSRVAAVSGQTFTSSFSLQLIAGTAPPAGSGLRSSILGENSSLAAVEFFGSAISTPATETLVTVTGTLANATTVTARAAPEVVIVNGVTYDYTVRVKAFQFEQASTYSRYQRTITANEWYEPGFTSYRGIRFDGSDDFLQTTAIDFAGAESLGAELVTNGTFAVDANWDKGTGWTISGGVATKAAGTASNLGQVIPTLTAGRAYRVTFNVTVTAGELALLLTGGTTNFVAPSLTTSQTVSVTIPANAGNNYVVFVANAAFAGTIDNVSVREVLIPADKMTVVAGVRKLSDAAYNAILDISADPNTTVGSLALGSGTLNGDASRRTWASVLSGSVPGLLGGAPVYAAPDTKVVAVSYDIAQANAADEMIMRLNGAQQTLTISGSNAGTGNFGNHPAFIGRRNGTANPFNGVLTFLCVINRTLTASELAQLENYANLRTGAY